jgi:hypothetical protein
MAYLLADLIGFQNWHGRDTEYIKLYHYHELNLGRSFAYLFTFFYLNERHRSREISNQKPVLAQLNPYFSLLPPFLVLNLNEWNPTQNSVYGL